MSFLEKNKKSKKSKDVINLETQDITDSFLYFFVGTFYYMKKSLGTLSGMIIVSLFFLILLYRKFLSRRKETEMIDGMEVPKLKDNYDLSLD